MGTRKNTYRFAVGSAEAPASFVWRFFVSGSDVYLGARDALTHCKVSLHGSGKWRAAWTNPIPGSDADRAFLKWTRPGEFATGWTPSIAVLIPSLGAVSPFAPRRVSANHVQFFPTPAIGKKLTFKVLFSCGSYSEVDYKRVGIAGDIVVSRFVRQGGEAVWLILREEIIAPSEMQMMQSEVAKFGIHLRSGATGENLQSRALVFTSVDSPEIATQPTLLDLPLGRDNLVPSPL